MTTELNILGKMPPQNIEAEQSVLGSMMLDKEAIPIVAEILKSDDFYREDHGEIYEAIMDLFNKAEPVDIVTVTEQLKARGTLDKAGGLDYITNIAISVPTTANVRYYASIVEEKSILRKLIKASSQIIDMSYEASEEISVILDNAERNIFDILQKRSSKGFYHVKEILVEAFNRLEELYNKREFITGVPSGFIDLDYKTAGFQDSDLILIASRPSMGKTSFALNIAQHAAIYKRIPVAVFSLEMSREQLVNRILCSEALIDSQKMRTGIPRGFLLWKSGQNAGGLNLKKTWAW